MNPITTRPVSVKAAKAAKSVSRLELKPAGTKSGKTDGPRKVLAERPATAPLDLSSAGNATNERLRTLVGCLGIGQEEALNRFNFGMGFHPLSMSAWKSYFVKPSSTRFRRFNEILMAHAERRLGSDAAGPSPFDLIRPLLMKPSQALAELVGEALVSKADATRMVWTYAFSSGLVDVTARDVTIRPDAKIAAAVGKARLSLFELLEKVEEQLVLDREPV